MQNTHRLVPTTHIFSLWPSFPPPLPSKKGFYRLKENSLHTVTVTDRVTASYRYLTRVDPGGDVGQSPRIRVVPAGAVALEPLLYELLQIVEAGPGARLECVHWLHPPPAPLHLQALQHHLKIRLRDLIRNIVIYNFQEAETRRNWFKNPENHFQVFDTKNHCSKCKKMFVFTRAGQTLTISRLRASDAKAFC